MTMVKKRRVYLCDMSEKNQDLINLTLRKIKYNMAVNFRAI